MFELLSGVARDALLTQAQKAEILNLTVRLAREREVNRDLSAKLSETLAERDWLRERYTEIDLKLGDAQSALSIADRNVQNLRAELSRAGVEAAEMRAELKAKKEKIWSLVADTDRHRDLSKGPLAIGADFTRGEGRPPTREQIVRAGHERLTAPPRECLKLSWNTAIPARPILAEIVDAAIRYAQVYRAASRHKVYHKDIFDAVVAYGIGQKHDATAVREIMRERGFVRGPSDTGAGSMYVPFAKLTLKEQIAALALDCDLRSGLDLAAAPQRITVTLKYLTERLGLTLTAASTGAAVAEAVRDALTALGFVYTGPGWARASFSHLDQQEWTRPAQRD